MTSFCGVDELRAGLRQNEVIQYKTGGCRAVSGRDFLPKAIAAARKIGVTRVGDVSNLIDVNYPVSELVRPNLVPHYSIGMNTSTQGKGSSVTQSLLSCLVEGVEQYCQQLRDAETVRGSFRQLSRSHVIIDPTHSVRSLNSESVHVDENVLWRAAYCPEFDCTVLVPAESFSQPSLVEDFTTRSIFPRGSNGIAAGTSYLDATIHAIYELIERRFAAHVETQKAFTAFQIESPDSPLLRRFLSALKGNYKVALQMIQIAELPAIPVFSAMIFGPWGPITGYGCCFDFEIAIERALSEAVQGLATVASGIREDQIHYFRDIGQLPQEWRWPFGFSPRKKSAGPRQRRETDGADLQIKTGSIEEARAISGALEYTTLQGELTLLEKWLKDAGYGTFYVCNLTHRSIGIPTVMALIPNLASPERFLRSSSMTWQNVTHYQYRSAFRNELADFWQSRQAGQDKT